MGRTGFLTGLLAELRAAPALQSSQPTRGNLAPLGIVLL